jgi:hypothetical protein
MKVGLLAAIKIARRIRIRATKTVAVTTATVVGVEVTTISTPVMKCADMLGQYLLMASH